MKIKRIASIFMLSMLLLSIFIANSTKRVNNFYCATHVDSFNNSTSVHTDVQIFTFSDNTGLITQRGNIFINDDKYNIDREVNIIITHENRNGFITIESRGVLKKPNDNVPSDSAWSKIYMDGIKYYIEILRTKKGDIIITEKGAPTYVCSQERK